MKPVAHLTDDEFSHLVQRAVNELPDAPVAMQQAALALWPRGTLGGLLVSTTALVQAVAHQIAAQLSFDSWATSALASGMRSGRGRARHLLFTADGRDIDLRITPAAGGFALAGQVLGPDDQGVAELVHAAAGGGAQIRVNLDDLGAFRFERIEPGRYLMTLHLGPDAIVLPPLEVGALVD